jgi:hypothetical protein
MTTTFNVYGARCLRIQSLALISVLLLPTFVLAEDELPAAPTPRLRLQGTMASMNVAPSKLTEGPAQAMAPAGPPAPALKIVILEGEDVSNNVKERIAREPVIQVEDENHKPVAGAAVLFSIDSQGGHAGASFLNGAKTFSGQTDANGRIVARGYRPNTHTGQFHINVTASKGNQTSHATISQTNIVVAGAAGASTAGMAGFLSTHVVLVSLVVAGAVVGGVVGGAIVTGNSSRTTITTGTGTVGAPQFVSAVRAGVRR